MSRSSPSVMFKVFEFILLSLFRLTYLVFNA